MIILTRMSTSYDGIVTILLNTVCHGLSDVIMLFIIVHIMLELLPIF